MSVIGESVIWERGECNRGEGSVEMGRGESAIGERGDCNRGEARL